MGFYTQAQLEPLQPHLPNPGDPIILNRPRALASYERKLADVYPELLAQGAAQNVLSPLVDLDVRAVERGQMPMSRDQTARIAAAATQTPEDPYGRAISPAPETGTSITDLPANAISDLRAIFTSIPKLPATLAKQVMDLPNAPTRLAEATRDPSKLTEVPGLNLVPGVFTAANILGGQPSELLKHPLMTALDVAPYAKARVFDAPASMLDEAGNLSRRATLRESLFPNTRITTREIDRALGRNAMGDTGKVSIVDLAANTRAGRAAGAVKDRALVAARGSRAGTELYAGLGRDTRNLIIGRNQTSHLVNELVSNPNAAYWTDPGRSRVYANAFDADRPALVKLQELESTYGDDYGKATYGSIDAWKARRQELGRIVQHDPHQIARLPEHEQVFLRAYEDAADTLIEPYTSTRIDDPKPFGRVSFTTPQGREITEVLPFEQAQRIWATRERVAAHDEMAFLHRAVSDDDFRGSLSEQDILDRAATSDILQSSTTSAATKSKVLAGYAHALTAKGINARPFLRDVMKARYGPVPTPAIADLATITERLPPGLDPPMILDQLDEAVQPRAASTRTASGFKRTDIAEPLKEIRGLLHTQQYTPLKRRLNEVFDRLERGTLDPASVPESFRNLDRDVVNASIEQMRLRSQWGADADVRAMASTRAKTQLARGLERLEARSAPARFYPKFTDMVNERMGNLARDLTDEFMAGNPQAGADLVRAVEGGNIGRLDDLTQQAYGKSAQDLYARFAQESRDSWQSLVDEGFDPKFVHHVPVGRGGKVHFASVNLSARKPGSWHARTLNLVPSEMDLSLALKSDAIDLLLKKGEDHMIDVITKGSEAEGWLPLARTKTDLLTTLEPVIDAELRRRGGDVALRPAVAEEVLNKTHVAFDAQQFRNLPSSEGQSLYRAGAKATPGKLTGVSATDQLYIPKSVYRAIEQLQSPPTARAVWDPVMGAFRTSTLILSPRWQVYNLLGNGLMGVASGGWDFLRELPRSVEILKRARKMESTPEISLGMKQSLGEAGKDQLEYAALAGEGLSKAVSSLPRPAAETLTAWGRPLGRGFTKTQDFLVRMNAMVDDVAKISSYLAGERKALRRAERTPGFAADTARGADVLATRAGGKAPNPMDMRRVDAENMMRDWTYNWDQLTPWERSTARFIFPFYGFFSHILRYAGRYAVDHPFRTAVLASFARAELEDWGTGLPERIHNMLIIGKRDEAGNQTGLNFGGWSPFADTANLFSLTGWMSQVNPLITTAAEQLGIDPRTGEAGVYPATAYDPVSGRLTIAPPNAITSLIQNVIPQTQVVSSALGGDAELRRTNPDAAGRQLLSSLGIPLLWRDVNVPQEVASAELARENAARQAMSQALAQGSTGPVRAYPTLSAQVSQLQALQAGNPAAFAQVTQGLTPASYVDLAQRALIPGSG